MDYVFLRKKLLRYILVHSWRPVLVISCIIIGIHKFYISGLSYYSPASIRNLVVFSIGLPFALPFSLFECWLLLKIFMDLITGCQTKILTAIPNSRIFGIGFKSRTQKQYEFYTYKVFSKKGILIMDREVCNYNIVRGNTHTMQVLRYSNFVLSMSVGKKLHILDLY